jgi:signal transduction histidine kinase
MGRVRSRGEAIRQFIVDNVAEHTRSIVALTSEKFKISRQAVNSHIKRLVAQDLIVAEGNTRNRIYKLHAEIDITKELPLNDLAEDVVWREFVLPSLGSLPDNVMDIWNYGFTEMLNNAIDHSQGRYAVVAIEKNPAFSRISVADDGMGIFRRIQKLMGLQDERHAVLELSFHSML